MLYCGGKFFEKAEFLFKLIEKSPHNNIVEYNSEQLLVILEYLLIITCVIIGEQLSSANRFTSKEEQHEF